MQPSNSRILAAEAVGTAVLMIGGPGSAVLGSGIGTLGVALAFGLSLLVMAYAIGHISGCHINPAVTVAMVIARKIRLAAVPFYIIGQLIGAAIGATIVFGIARGLDDFQTFERFAQNGWDKWSPGGYGLGSTIIVEIIFTALLVVVVLATTHRDFAPGFNAIAVGLTLALIHMVTIPIDNTSVNPARSFGAAIFSDSDAWVQLWAFIVFPLIGAVLGVFIWLMISETRLEETMAFNPALAQARDMATNAIDEVVDEIEDATDRRD
ncbi:MAG: aquaporin [Acidimicrobiia bacterium]